MEIDETTKTNNDIEEIKNLSLKLLRHYNQELEECLNNFSKKPNRKLATIAHVGCPNSDEFLTNLNKLILEWEQQEYSVEVQYQATNTEYSALVLGYVER